jgi:sulfur relay (sulfurtransferase) complex TusBCD TusD component (DsrE family)
MSNQKFSDNSLWLFENFVTTAIKKINPISEYEQTARLSEFFRTHKVCLKLKNPTLSR